MSGCSDYEGGARFHRRVANRTACIRMTEINQHLGLSQSNLITEINSGDNVDAFTFRDTNDRLPHATGRAHQRDTQYCHKAMKTLSRSGGFSPSRRLYAARGQTAESCKTAVWSPPLLVVSHVQIPPPSCADGPGLRPSFRQAAVAVPLRLSPAT